MDIHHSKNLQSKTSEIIFYEILYRVKYEIYSEIEGNNNKTTQKWTNNEYAAKNAYSTLNIPELDGSKSF